MFCGFINLKLKSGEARSIFWGGIKELKFWGAQIQADSQMMFQLQSEDKEIL